ncbi:MAG: caspase family protein [Leptospira sp.]|nr:caspase family protein [Leptospira sp.]
MKRLIIAALICLSIPQFLYSQNRYGLIIGTNYKGNSAGIPPLDLCEKDATYLRDKIRKVGNFKDIDVLLGRQVTKANVEKAFRDIASKAKKDDTVFIYFSGHGTTQKDASAPNGSRNYLVCFDRPHISDKELNTYVSRISSPKTVFVLDCCYSGGIAQKGRATRGAGAIPIAEGSNGVVKQNADDYYFQNKPIIASSNASEVSWEVGGSINQGIFTYNFGKALESGDLNGDKVVTALEAFFVARDGTQKMAKSLRLEQNPQISGDASGVMLAGNLQPSPPPAPSKPPTNIAVPLPPTQQTPPPSPVPPVSTPVSPPAVVTPVEPPAPPVKNTGNILIKTTIIKAKEIATNRGQNPYDLLKRQGLPSQTKGRDAEESSDRRIKVLINGEEYPSQVRVVKSNIWGSSMSNGRLIPGEIYHVLVKDLPTGIHQVKVLADDYPQFETAVGVLPRQDNIVDMVSSIKGYGAIQGRVFYKSLDNPVSNHPIYMPTIVSTRGVQKVKTDNDGYFHFTNLKAGTYEIRASFAEDLKLENSNIKVTPGEVTKVDIILNVKMPSTKTKY